MHQLTNLETACACILLLLTVTAIVIMIACSYKTVADEAVREAKQAAEQRAKIIAERKFRQMIENAEIRVTQKIRIHNESDVDWGKEDIA